ncbi:unnamed protein product [Acanthoscelides obtectus]|uniref:C2H2-type domain-containing protein n=1 Tax=Acanthoscelides obtectus TaxID=200917 RepID=A0A9P0LAH4_ACAOB|nr:unnamed protein product [Acanthoscelides obtectus]CAK1659189.1 hypothetical protein AOBTE_LOCUS21334 [Acanthoscelides obtectus]
MLLSAESNAKTEPASSTRASQGSSFQTSFAQYLNKHELKDSEEKIDYGFILCIYCKAKFKSDTGLHNHIVRKHPEFMATVTRRIHECKMCSFKTTIL